MIRPSGVFCFRKSYFVELYIFLDHKRLKVTTEKRLCCKRRLVSTLKFHTMIYSSIIALCVFNAFLSYTAIMLNSVTIYALIKTSSLPKNSKTLLLSLAVSDLGVGSIVQPLHIAALVMQLQPNFENNPTFKATLIAHLISEHLLCIASFLCVTTVTVDRFLAVHFYLRYNELVTHKRVVAAVISVWVLSAIFSLIGLLVPARKGAFVIFATIGSICLIATAGLYYKIYLAVRHHANQIHALQVQEARNDEMANAARLRKSAVATFYVYLVFLVCYLPRICFYVALTISGSSTATKVLSDYTITLVLLNSSLNPLIYCWKMSDVRHTIMDILRKIWANHN